MAPMSRLSSRQRALRTAHDLMFVHSLTTDDILPPRPEPKITLAPGYTHDARYQVDPAARVVGGFFSEWISMRGSA